MGNYSTFIIFLFTFPAQFRFGACVSLGIAIAKLVLTSALLRVSKPICSE